MKISTKGRYALRLMADLARWSQDGPVPIRDIAERQEMSEKYLEQIVRPLVKEGLVRSVRGAQGGYELALPANQITVGVVLRATEGDLVPVSCVADGGECDKHDNCDTIFVWRKISDAVAEVVDSITIADVAERPQECPAVPDITI